MRRNVRLLAVSRMQGGVCIAGVVDQPRQWVRLVKQRGPVTVADLRHGTGDTMHPLDLVTFNLIKRSPSPPHVEDWIADFAGTEAVQRPRSDRDRAKVLAELAELSPEEVLVTKSQSLVMIEPDEIDMIVFDPHGYNNTYKARLSFLLDGRKDRGEAKRSPGYPVTDIKLRGWGRRFRVRKVMNDSQLRQALRVERIYLVLGLARSLEGNNWPMVVGFHTVPDYSGAIDFSNP